MPGLRRPRVSLAKHDPLHRIIHKWEEAPALGTARCHDSSSPFLTISLNVSGSSFPRSSRTFTSCLPALRWQPLTHAYTMHNLHFQQLRTGRAHEVRASLVSNVIARELLHTLLDQFWCHFLVPRRLEELHDLSDVITGLGADHPHWQLARRGKRGAVQQQHLSFNAASTMQPSRFAATTRPRGATTHSVFHMLRTRR